MVRISFWVAAVSCACGGAAPPAEEPEAAAEAAPATEPAPAVDTAEAPAADAPAAAGDSEGLPELPAAAADEAPAEAEDDRVRSVQYLLSNEGLRVEVEGVVLSTSAKAEKSGKGWGVQIDVEARSDDGKPHSLLAPPKAELAFAGKIRRQGSGEPETFGDKREGDREIVLGADKPAKLTRDWPGKGGAAPLAPGDEIELAVGLWGIGPDAATRRPLRKLCKVTLKFNSKGKPRVILAPPDGVAK